MTVLKTHFGRAFSCIARVARERKREESGRLLPAGRALERERGKTGAREKEKETERAGRDRGVAGRRTYDGEDNDART